MQTSTNAPADVAVDRLPYPKLVQGKKSGNVYLSTSSMGGTLLHIGPNSRLDADSLGEFQDDFKETGTVDFVGTLSIGN